MATAEIDGTTIAYEVIGADGPPWVVTPGGRFSKDEPGIRELAGELAAHGQPRRDLGPPQHRRLRRVLRGCIGVGDAGRQVGRVVARARPGTGRHRRRLRRRARLTPHRGEASRRDREARDALDLRWRVRLDAARRALLRRVDPRRVARRDGSGRGAARVGGSARTQPGEPRTVPRPRPARLHRDPRALDARVLPAARGDSGGPHRRRMLPSSRSRPSCSAAAAAIRTTRGRRPSGSPSSCRTPGSSSRRGATTSGTNAATRRGPAPGISSNAGRSWRPNCSTSRGAADPPGPPARRVTPSACSATPGTCAGGERSRRASCRRTRACGSCRSVTPWDRGTGCTSARTRSAAPIP